MEQPANPALAERLRAAFAWWQLAGVDQDFADRAQNWLDRPDDPAVLVQAAPAAPPPRAPAAPPEPAIPPRADLPGDLPGFIAWWLAEPALDGGRVAGRVPPRGQAGADLMVLVEHPEADDSDRLLSGPQGRLLDAMLAAMGVAAERAYIASALPRHTPHADWPELRARGLAEIAAHHVGLVAPARLLVLGGNALPLPGNDPPLSPASLQRFNHGRGTVPLLVEPSLSVLLARPGSRSALWRRWLDWTAKTESMGRETT